MRFVCGACGETIKTVNSPKHHASFVPHTSENGEPVCGYETFFPTHVVTAKNLNPKPTRVRRIGDDGEGVPIKDFRRDPSADDLDRVEAEKKSAAVGFLIAKGYDPRDAEAFVDSRGADAVLAAKQEEDAIDSADAAQRKEEAVAFVESRGYSREAAEKIVEKEGVVKILAAKTEEELSREQENKDDAVEYLISIGKSKEEAEKLISEVGVDKILKSKSNADAKAAKKAEKEAKREAAK